MSGGSSAPSDHADRQLAIRERSANLLVDAGAGTGKTRLVVDRLLEMIAPADDGVSFPLDRIAAITFTRRAAGELRLRLRESLLARLADTSLSEQRRSRLLAAVGLIDTAFIGTIHGFADRLLRLCPVETDLSPSYDIVQDEEDLVQEAFLEMLHAAQAGTLRARFASSELANRAGEVEETLVQAIEAGVRANTEELDVYARVGLDWLVRDMLRTRDHRAIETGTPHFDDVGFRRAVNEYLILVRSLTDATNGERWMLSLARRLRDLGESTASKDLFDLVRSIDQATRKDALKPTKDFAKGPGRDAWTTFSDRLANDLRRPIERWMAGRLLRIAPIAEAIYDSVKRRRGNVDTVDLLLKLAQLLRTDFAARKRYQSLFDHIFVDEFQDTDPLQAEIVLFLAEKEATAKVWSDTVLGKGRLTLVGDPKQSIYRFRRADVTMYQAIHTHIARQPGTLSITLRDNFRSDAGLVNWFNDRFTRVLGTSGDGRIVDPSTGGVFYRPLTASRRAEAATEPSSIHVLPLAREAEDRRNAAELRALEGEAIAGYVRWLVETSSIRIADPYTGTPRKTRYSDIAVLALVTTQLQPLFGACDDLSVPYATAGGTLFLRDPLHRQFLLALRALSDPDDGVAEAAIMRPPFFAIDLWDVLQARAPNDAQPDQHAAERGRAARNLVRTLRRERFTQSPGTIARRLIDETALGRVTALGPNGDQRLKHLRELCTSLDQRAALASLDFDGMTALARSWVDCPIQFDAPRPLWSDALQVLTVHQAKGLEFPVVVLWDSCGAWSAADRRPVFVVDRTQRKWALRVEGLSWEEPEGGLLLDRAQSEADAERRRVVYVAATRARDLLVVPHAPGSKFDDPKRAIHAMLVADSPKHVHFAEPYSRTQRPGWYARPAPRAAPRVDSSVETVREAWRIASTNAKAPRFVPGAVSAHSKLLETRLQLATGELAAPPPREHRRGRFGPLFGETVHVALGLALTKRLAPTEAVERAVRVSGLAEHHVEAAADVGRALETLEREGLSTASTWRLEYPVAQVFDGHLLTGYADFVAVTATYTTVVDFKTDSAPTGRAEASHPGYVAQVQAYVAMLRPAVAGAEGFRGGLLWTETGRLEWV